MTSTVMVSQMVMARMMRKVMWPQIRGATRPISLSSLPERRQRQGQVLRAPLRAGLDPGSIVAISVAPIPKPDGGQHPSRPINAAA